MAETLTIRRLVDRIISGEIRIPAFQREWVWTPQQVSFLLDSIHKGFPVGMVFLWKTNTKLESEKDLGNYTIPEPRKEHPVYYVLDGQQRLTSLFSVFQTELASSDNYEWLDIYYDFEASDGIQDSKFVSLAKADVVSNRHFPMAVVFDAGRFYEEVNKLDPTKRDQILKVQQMFQEYSLPVQEFETDSRESIAIVFERINRAGTPLNTYQLLTAWSWSADFDLQEEFSELAEELKLYGFGNLAQDKDLQLKCSSGIIRGETSPAIIISLTGEEVRGNFNQIRNGIKGAIEFLRDQLKVHSLEWLPYPSMLISLSAFFATSRESGQPYTDKQRKELIRWFWKSNFSRRYNAGVQDKHKLDIAAMRELAKNEDVVLSNFDVRLEESFFLDTPFNVGSVNTKTFVLMLANRSPRSFISGANVRLGDVLKSVNRNEFHHIFPKKHLERQGVDKKKINCLVNFCFLNNADNQKIKDKDPNVYKSLLPSQSVDNILSSAICPSSSLDMNFDQFLNERARLLVSVANDLSQ
ncbi:GmrSD restriction endonuclease domain-containing protein [Pseudochryseolinea flava]|uniref:GmrSD restriction endonucleases N-terminal domain-containing protein n=1 Tax=Pseudochryseolinea flava TaxID=2059302 RepID=A0A364XXX9_9BACT|nr:DUF262 domain-containing protein [Pseudochryseolinea flava]RAV99161.1 hypothetical protein DQQ10_19870 [Pseudochryseolinea flava]